MLIRTCRTFFLLQDRFLHLVWQQLALVVLPEVQVAQEDLAHRVVLLHLVGHHLVMVLVTVMVVEEVLDLAMVPSILVVDQVIMDLTGDMVHHLLDQEVTVAAMVEVVREDLEGTVDHLVDSIHQRKTVTRQVVDIHQDLRTAFPLVVLPVAIHLREVLAIILDLAVLHTQDLVVPHTLDQGVLLMVDHLILALVVLHILDLAVHNILVLAVHQDLVLQAKVDHLGLELHRKLFSLVLPLQAPIQHLQPHQQMDLPHPPQPQAQQTLLLLALTLLPLPIIHLQLLPPNLDQLGLHLHIHAHQAHHPLTTLPPTPPMVVHPQVHTTTHPQQASPITQATHHILHLATLQVDLHLDIHPVVLHLDLQVMVVHHRQAIIPQDKEVIHLMDIKEDQEDTLDRLHLVDTRHTVLLVVLGAQWVPLLLVVILRMTKTDMVLHQDQVGPVVPLLPKDGTHRTAYQLHVDQADTRQASDLHCMFTNIVL